MNIAREVINSIIESENIIKRAGGQILEDGIINISNILPKDMTSEIRGAIDYLINEWSYSIETEQTKTNKQ